MGKAEVCPWGCFWPCLKKNARPFGRVRSSNRSDMAKDKSNLQLIWGIALLLAGVGVVFRVDQVMPKIVSIESLASAGGYIRFCFYFMAVILVGGGLKKIIAAAKESRRSGGAQKD